MKKDNGIGNMIVWGAKIDRHIKGVGHNAVWYIRFDKKGETVLALYKINKKTEKFLPDDGIEETELGIKLRAEIIEEQAVFAKKIAKNEVH